MDNHRGSNQVDEKASVAVVVVPLPAQGHLNQLLHLSRLVSAHGIPVHYIGSATHNRQAKHRVHGWNLSSASNIHFHDFPLSFHTPPPDPLAYNKFPAHLEPTFNAALNLREPLAALLQSLSKISQRVVVIHDTLMSFAAKEASSLPNGEAYFLNTCSAFCTLFFRWEALGRPTNTGIERLNEDYTKFSFDGCFTDTFGEFITRQLDLMKLDVGEISNTCRPIESKFIDLLDQELYLQNRKQWAIGPLNPVEFDGGSSSISRHNCLEWLDKQPPNSVIYVAFGTMTSISNLQIREIAIGLEQSEQRFVWVLREADRADVYAHYPENEVKRIELPIGYKERVKGVGVIVRDWAPQLEILAHASIGGFLSHCGWNSCMESLSMGVPIAAWPMHSDQPMNSTLVTEELKVGLVVREWAKRDELVSSSIIESAVRRLMASKDGQDMRRRAEKLGVAARQAIVSKDGSSSTALASFIAHISRS